MGPYTIEKYDRYRAIVVTLRETYRIGKDYPEAQLKTMYNALNAPYHFVVDFTAKRLTVEDLTHMASGTARGDDPLLQNPNIDRIFVISESDLVRLAARGLNSPIFGSINVTVCKSLGEVFQEIKLING